VGHGVSTPEEAGVLQECLDNLVKWAEELGMQFNAEKCKVMHVGRSNQRFQYSMGGVVLGETEEEKDVGVTINRSLKPSGQCTRAANTARGVLGQVTRSFHYRDRHVSFSYTSSMSGHTSNLQHQHVPLASRRHQSPGGCPDPGSEDGVWPKIQGLPREAGGAGHVHLGGEEKGDGHGPPSRL
jgi:hypothetical protein